jgi:hypothetical protein
MDESVGKEFRQFAKELLLAGVDGRYGAMAYQDEVTASRSSLHRPGKRIQSSRKHQDTFGVIEGPILLLTQLQILLLMPLVSLHGNEGERVLVVCQET